MSTTTPPSSKVHTLRDRAANSGLSEYKKPRKIDARLDSVTRGMDLLLETVFVQRESQEDVQRIVNVLSPRIHFFRVGNRV